MNRSAWPRTSLTSAPARAAAANSLQHRALVEGVAALRQALGANQPGTDRLLVLAVVLGEVTRQPLPARLQQLRDPACVETLLAGAGPDLLPPRVRLKPVLLALPRRERRVLRRAL